MEKARIILWFTWIFLYSLIIGMCYGQDNSFSRPYKPKIHVVITDLEQLQPNIDVTPIKFKDKNITGELTYIIHQHEECFSSNQCYALFFYTSNLTNQYYIQIDRTIDNYQIKNFPYYTIIANTCFLISADVPQYLFATTGEIRKIQTVKYEADPEGDMRFLFHGGWNSNEKFCYFYTIEHSCLE